MSGVHLITGGAGYLGQQLAMRLLQAGERVRSFDVLHSKELDSAVEQVRGDVRDATQVRKALADVEVVHHHAAMVPVTRDRTGFTQVNVHGSENVAKETARAGIKRLFFVSTSAVFNLDETPPYGEHTSLKPIEPYGKAKLQGEQLVRKVCDKEGVQLVVIRPRTIVGHHRLGVLGTYFDWMAEDLRIPLVGDGKNLFQFVHVSDLVDFYMLALEKDLTGNFNVGCERFGALGDDLEEAARQVGSKSKILNLPVRTSITLLRTLDALNLSPFTGWHYLTMHKPFHFDISPLLELGWKPKYSNVEMLTESYRESRTKQTDDEASVHQRNLKERALGLVKAYLKLSR